jgi:hypothetical protein
MRTSLESGNPTWSGRGSSTTSEAHPPETGVSSTPENRPEGTSRARGQHHLRLVPVPGVVLSPALNDQPGRRPRRTELDPSNSRFHRTLAVDPLLAQQLDSSRSDVLEEVGVRSTNGGWTFARRRRARSRGGSRGSLAFRCGHLGRRFVRTGFVGHDPERSPGGGSRVYMAGEGCASGRTRAHGHRAVCFTPVARSGAPGRAFRRPKWRARGREEPNFAARRRRAHTGPVPIWHTRPGG